MPSGETRDIGWDHGEIVDGNRFHLMCNWCGLIRCGGGVSRLKNPLPATAHVRKCPEVPVDISKSITNHLIEKRGRRKPRSTQNLRFVGRELSDSYKVDVVHMDSIKRFMDMQEKSVGMLNQEANDQCKITNTVTKSSKSANQHSRATSQLPKTKMTKDVDTRRSLGCEDGQCSLHTRLADRGRV